MDFASIFKTKSFNEGMKFIGVGVILILFSLLLHTLHLIETKNSVWLFLNELFVQLFSHFGIGCLAIGGLTIILDMEHWTNYFENRLSKIVTNKDFLQKLSPFDLINLQTEVLKVYFKNDEIGGEEGFLKYYQKHIQEIIGLPYRINVLMNLKVQRIPDNNTQLEVFETMTYTCINNKDNIQDNICYLPDENEYEAIKDFSVILHHEDFVNSHGGDDNGQILFKLEKLQEIKACEDVNKGFKLEIAEYNRKRLNVIVKANFIMNKNRFIGWRMSHPTHKLTFNINYPSDFNISKEFFFNENNTINENIDNGNGNYVLILNDWLLPDEGITFQLIEK